MWKGAPLCGSSEGCFSRASRRIINTYAVQVQVVAPRLPSRQVAFKSDELFPLRREARPVAPNEISDKPSH
jgi:hypothetical protein